MSEWPRPTTKGPKPSPPPKGGARRAETEWEDDPTQSPIIGSAASSPPVDRERFVGRLFIPDPEQRHGLREWYVYPDAPKPERRVGFRHD